MGREGNETWTDLKNAAFEEKRFLCVGFDPKFDDRWEQANNGLKNDIMDGLFRLCISKVKSVGRIAGFIKPNWAFFVQYGWRGLQVLERVVLYTNQEFPNVVVILDMKVGDIGDTNKAYIRAAFDELGGDAITIHPYLGKEANSPFLNRADKGIIVLCHTSNPGADEFQHLPVGENDPLFLKVAGNVATGWNYNGNCALVTGATYPFEIAQVRNQAPTLPLLLPGVGKQGGDLRLAVGAAMRADGNGFIVNASSSIFDATDSANAATDLNNAILAARK